MSASPKYPPIVMELLPGISTTADSCSAAGGCLLLLSGEGEGENSVADIYVGIIRISLN